MGGSLVINEIGIALAGQPGTCEEKTLRSPAQAAPFDVRGQRQGPGAVGVHNLMPLPDDPIR